LASSSAIGPVVQLCVIGLELAAYLHCSLLAGALENASGRPHLTVPSTIYQCNPLLD